MSTDRHMHYFALLTEAEQRDAIRRLASSGMVDTGIAAATRLSVEQIRQILGVQPGCTDCDQ